MAVKNTNRNRISIPKRAHSIARDPKKYREASSPFAWIDKLMANIPPEELDKFPVDGSVNHDHYLYGAPKQVFRGSSSNK